MPRLVAYGFGQHDTYDEIAHVTGPGGYGAVAPVDGRITPDRLVAG